MKSRSRHHRLQNSDPPDDWVNGSWTVDCVCGVNFDDGEEMVNCDECGVWVHTRCSRYVKGDDIFVCDKCKIKNNRNESEETEVAQLLVELPTKTVRMESSYAGAHGASRRPPFRLWTDIPIEERVHVQGKPGGDPAMFAGLSSVFTPELWKCTGYVPKKFNFRVKEFSCWDEKEDKSKLDEQNENPVDKGAGVLFSLSKERGMAAPVAADLIGLRGREVEEFACDQRKVCLKERKKWDIDGLDVRRTENGATKESSLVRSVAVHAGKRKKEDSGTSKDRIGRKKARAFEEVDARKRETHSSKTVFTPTSDAKHLAFYEDRAQKFRKDEVRSTKSKKPREAVVSEPVSDRHPAGTGNAKNHLKETSSVDVAAKDCSANTGNKGDKLSPQHPEVPECSPKTDDAVCSVGNLDNAAKMHIKEEGDGMSVSKLDDSLENSDKNVSNSLVKGATRIVEVKQNKVEDSIGDLQLKSEHLNSEVKRENLDNSSGPLLNVQYSTHHDAKDPAISSNQISEIPKLNGITVMTSWSSDHMAEDLDQSSEVASDSHVRKAGQLPDDPGLLKSELEGTEGLMALQKSPKDKKHGSAFPEEHSKPGGTVPNFHALSSQRKMVACTGKPSTSTASLIPKSCTFENLKSANALNPNPIVKPQNTHDINVNVRKDRASLDGRDESRDENSRTVKERQKSVGNPIPKPSNSSRNSHDSLPKKTTAEAKENVLSASSKSSSSANVTVPSGSGEPVVQLHHQRATHMYNRSSASGLSQKGEKPHQPNFQPPSKINQTHVPSVCPPITSSAQTALSDEELALLLHQELNSSPRVPRVPRMRNAGSLPQLASPSTTSMLMKRTSSSGGKDHCLVPRRKYRNAPRDGIHGSHEADEPKRMDGILSSHDPKRRDTDFMAEATTKEDNGSLVMESVKKNAPSTSAATNSGPSSSNEANDRNLSSIRSSPRNTSDDDTSMLGGPVHQTLPGLINEIMSKGRRMTYEELCNAVLPHWHNLRKHNGERYAYTSHSQAVLDCLRNRHEWARLVDRGPKTNSSRKRRKLDAEDSEDNDYGKGKATNQVESKSLESQKEDFPKGKGKRNARKRRRLALQGKGIKDIRKRRKQDRFTDEDFGTSSNSSEESVSSEDEIQGGGVRLDGSEASSSSHEEGTM